LDLPCHCFSIGDTFKKKLLLLIRVILICFYGPSAAVLGRLPGTTVYRNTLQYPEAYTYNGIVVVRIDSPIYFANISYIKDR
jgi:MFS superfamily sulfate permease-like transporter